MKPFLTRPPLRWQISSIAVFGILVLGAMAAMLAYANLRRSGEETAASAFDSAVVSLLQSGQDFEESRALVAQLVNQKQTALLAREQAATAEAAQALDSSRRSQAALPGLPPAPAAETAEIARLLKVYAAQVDALVAELRRTGLDGAGLEADLATASQALEDQIGSLDDDTADAPPQDQLRAARLRAALMSVHSEEKDFRLTGNTVSSARIGSALSDVSDQIDALPLDAETAQKLHDSLAAYRDTFRRYSDASVDLLSQLDQVRIISDKLSHALRQGVETIGAARAADQARRQASEARLLKAEYAATALLALLLLTGSLRIGHGIARRVAVLAKIMHALVGGDHAVVVPGSAAGDEIGGMARAVEVFKAHLADRARLAVAQEEERTAREQRARRLEELVGHFQEEAARLVSLLSDDAAGLRTTSREMGRIATQTSTRAGELVGAAASADSSVQMVAASAEQLGASIEEIDRQVALSATAVQHAVADTRRTDKVVAALSEGAQKIGDVVSLIAAVARQTNLLALNATIEAARAGEAGKGFAVVADEVKTLASRTRGATEEIAAQIGLMQEATREAVTAVAAVNGVIGDIDRIATAIAEAVHRQGSATEEIKHGIQQVVASTQAVGTLIDDVGGAARESGTAATRVLDSASQLLDRSQRLDREVGGFVAGVTAL